MVTVVIEWFSKGGVIMWPILLFSVYGMSLCFERWMQYRKEEKALSSRWTIIKDTSEKTKEGALSLFNEDHSSDRITRIILGNGDTDQSVLIEQVRCTYLDENANIEKHLGIISVVATLLPMLGLLGTVMGMIESFDAIAQFGSGNPSVVADGISEALITTEAGLITSIPLFYFHQVLSGRADSLIRRLNEYTMHILHIFSPGTGK
jgi:biopolymer transport protein ExbB